MRAQIQIISHEKRSECECLLAAFAQQGPFEIYAQSAEAERSELFVQSVREWAEAGENSEACEHEDKKNLLQVILLLF